MITELICLNIRDEFPEILALMNPQDRMIDKIKIIGEEIDFENETFVVDTKESAQLPWDVNATAVINLPNAVTANSTHPLFLAFGIEFYQEVNGVKYPLKNGAYNALSLVKVNGL